MGFGYAFFRPSRKSANSSIGGFWASVLQMTIRHVVSCLLQTISVDFGIRIGKLPRPKIGEVNEVKKNADSFGW